MNTRVAIIDSGVRAGHPFVGQVAGGVAIYPDGSLSDDYHDPLGHGTAVAAVIREKAPDALLYAVNVFHESLATRVTVLVRAIDWCIENRMRLINMSLGTSNPAHETPLLAAVDRARSAGATLVAAADYLPGRLVGVIPVAVDWDCPRDQIRAVAFAGGRSGYAASGYPRPVYDDIPPEHHPMKGISFAVANVTGWLAAHIEVLR